MEEQTGMETKKKKVSGEPFVKMYKCGRELTLYQGKVNKIKKRTRK